MIIFKENKKIEQPLKRKCIECNSELGIEKDDIIMIQKKWMWTNFNAKGFCCPICNTKQELDND